MVCWLLEHKQARLYIWMMDIAMDYSSPGASSVLHDSAVLACVYNVLGLKTRDLPASIWHSQMCQ
jgi:hypothetical protein